MENDPILTKGTEPTSAIVARIYDPEDPERPIGVAHKGDVVTVAVVPTQIRRPWRATLRSAFQGLVALAVMLPVLVTAAGLDPAKVPYLAGVLAVAAAITRIMALPQVDEFLARFLPFLSAGR